MATLAARITALAQAIGADIKALTARDVPVGGTTGQVLTKASNVNYAMAWSTPAPAPTLASAVLSAALANSTVTPAVLTGHTFTIPPGKTLQLTGQLIFTAAAITTGAAIGIRVAQAAGADGAALGSWFSGVMQSSAAGTALEDGDTFNVTAGTNSLGELLGLNTTAGNNAIRYQAVVKNASTNVNTTVTVEFRSEVAASAVTAQIGSGGLAVIG